RDKRSDNEIGADILLLSGDQVYADDVAGAMLITISRLIDVLGIYKEQPLDIELPEDLQQQLYQRHLYLPKVPWQKRNKIGV
ncbi:hypothetical protein, partial [Streptomyces turgidiscabies]|uniref:hypothetical protein n=1 Tax=Streptomyces turgidiscabies TaxID=85558 RepID=UPI0038F7A23F